MQSALADYIGDNERLLAPLRDLFGNQRLLEYDFKNGQSHSTLLRDSLLEEFQTYYRDDIVNQISQVLNGYLEISEDSRSSDKKSQDSVDSIDTADHSSYKIEGPSQILADTTGEISINQRNSQSLPRIINKALARINKRILILGSGVALSVTIFAWNYYPSFRCRALGIINNTAYDECIKNSSLSDDPSRGNSTDSGDAEKPEQSHGGNLCDEGDKNFLDSLCSL